MHTDMPRQHHVHGVHGGVGDVDYRRLQKNPNGYAVLHGTKGEGRCDCSSWGGRRRARNKDAWVAYDGEEEVVEAGSSSWEGFGASPRHLRGKRGRDELLDG